MISTAIKKYGVVTVNADRLITHFEEKRKNPKEQFGSDPLYFYSRGVLPLYHRLRQTGITLINPVSFYSGSIGVGP